MDKYIELFSEQDTLDLAKKIAKLVNTGDVIALSGELGAGKTFFTQALCRYLGVSEYVSSPSYILLNEYQGRFPIAHFDLYRLDSLEEVFEIGLLDIIDQALTIIEWYQVAKEILPAHTIYLDFSLTPHSRKVHLHQNTNSHI